VNECQTTVETWDVTQLYADVAALYEDNCDDQLTVTVTDTIPGLDNSDCSWSFTYE